MDSVSWWPPTVGSILRHATCHGAGAGQIKRVEAKLHVLSVFEHDGETRIVTGEWFPSKRRWNYEVMGESAAFVGLIWRDGTTRPELGRP